MNSKWNNKYCKWGLTAFGVIAAAICFYFLVFHGADIVAGLAKLGSILFPIGMGLILAYLLTPVLNYIEYYLLLPIFKKCKVEESRRRATIIRGISVLLTICLLLLVIYGMVSIFLAQIIPSIVNIINNLQTYINNFTAWLSRMMEDNPTMAAYLSQVISAYTVDIQTLLENSLSSALSGTGTIIKTLSLSVISIISYLFDLLVGIAISVYVLCNKEKFAGQAKKITYALFERERANVIVSNVRFVHETFIGFIGGKVIDSVIIGALCFGITSILNTPYYPLISLVIGVTNMIPFFGPWIGGIPCAILVFIVDPLNPLNAVYFALVILILQQIDGNIIGPRILGDSTGLPGFWIIFAITFFGGIWGLAGMIIGVPVFAVVYAVIKALTERALDRRQMTTSASAYITLDHIEEDGTFKELTPEFKLHKTNKLGKGNRSKDIRFFQSKARKAEKEKVAEEDLAKNLAEDEKRG